MTKPFIKWVGGKSRLWPQLAPLLAERVESGRYFEPFLGSGAMFFALRPSQAVLSDINIDLITTYQAVRSEVEGVVAELQTLAASHSRVRYYAVRKAFNDSVASRWATRAAMFLYLNRTCFNGLHRLNSRGAFNVPAGDIDAPFRINDSLLRDVSAQLLPVTLRAESFEDALAGAAEGDFVYLDPPYEGANGNRGFTRYNGRDFKAADQELLRDVVGELDRRGCRFMLSNSDTPSNRRRYRDFEVQTIQAPRSVNRIGTGRSPVPELVVRNYAT